MAVQSSSSLFTRLAFSGIRRNRGTYAPYLIACVMAVMMFYTIVSLGDNPTLRSMGGGTNMIIILNVGTWILALFSLIFLFYTNSFLIKRRKKEFGLFTILGMEKKHVAAILALETLMTGAGAILLGLALGILLNKLLFLILLRIIHYDIQMGFSVSLKGVGLTAALFAGIFLLNLLFNTVQIGRSKPVELLHSDAAGEREPRTRKLLAIAGFIALAAGYILAMTVERPLDALTLFFIAVILVIIGTYLLFAAGSIAVLKQLKKRKAYYYKPTHFISVSGMIYRMKQNAVGLANICILSTMVLVVLSTTVSLYLGVDSIMGYLFPTDMSMVYNDTAFYGDRTGISDRVAQAVSGQGLALSGYKAYDELNIGTVRRGDTYDFHTGNRDYKMANELCMVSIITAEDYARCTGQTLTLADNQVRAGGNLFTPGTSLHFLGEDYTVTGGAAGFPSMESTYDKSFGLECLNLVVADREVLGRIAAKQQSAYGEAASPLTYHIAFNLNGTAAQKIACGEALDTPAVLNGPSQADPQAIVSTDQLALPGDSGTWDVRSRQAQYTSFYYTYGGILFLGILLGIIFLMATVLIIYYKQVSEGYDDRERFVIMQNVGMGAAEVRRAIRSQVLMVFFLPLLAAACHVAFAFPMITKLLALFSLQDMGLFTRCTAGVFILFAAFYALVYGVTARTYYKIVT